MELHAIGDFLLALARFFMPRFLSTAFPDFFGTVSLAFLLALIGWVLARQAGVSGITGASIGVAQFALLAFSLWSLVAWRRHEGAAAQVPAGG